MFFAPKPLTTAVLPPDVLEGDCRNAQHFEECGLGKKAVYLEVFGISCRRYIPLDRVTRVYKRLAVSKGFFELGKVFGTLSYLVVQFDRTEKVIRFTHEENVDAMLKAFRTDTHIPVGKK